MKLGKSDTTSKIDEVVSKSVNFEVTIADIARRSERRAWWVAGCAVAMSLVLASGYFYFLPLKEKVPYLVMADAYTGTSTVARLREDFNHPTLMSSDAIHRSNIAHFILARESYDVAMLNLRDWRTVYTMSEPEVAMTYTQLHSQSNASSPYNIYGNSRAIRVKILSITPIGGGNGSTPKGATVRFQRSLYDKTTGATQPLDSKIATLEFTYKSNLAMDEEDRIENPLGFRVTNYRVDNDYASAPPVETMQPRAQLVPAVPNLEVAAQIAPGEPGQLPAPGGVPAPTNGSVPPVGQATPANPNAPAPSNPANPTPAPVTPNNPNGVPVR